MCMKYTQKKENRQIIHEPASGKAETAHNAAVPRIRVEVKTQGRREGKAAPLEFSERGLGSLGAPQFYIFSIFLFFLLQWKT